MLEQRAVLLKLLAPAAVRVKEKKSNEAGNNLVTRALSFGRAPKKGATAVVAKPDDKEYEQWWSVLTEATGTDAMRLSGSASVSLSPSDLSNLDHEIELLPPVVGSDVAKLADCRRCGSYGVQ